MLDEILNFFEQSVKRQTAEAEETKKQLSALREALKTMGADGGLQNKSKLIFSLQQEIDGLKESELELISAATIAEEKLQKQNAELAKLKLQLKKESPERGKAAAGAAPAKPREEFAELNQAVKKNPSDLKALRQLADSYIRKDHFNKAIPHLLTAVKLKPKDAEIQFLLGDTYFKGKHFEESLHPLNQAVRLNPKFAKAHYDLCMVNEMVGNEEAASRHYKIALKLDPNIESSK